MTIIPTANPIEFFDLWYQEALQTKVKDQNAMVLATCSKDYTPSARVVLLKEYSKKEFVFFTNVNSRKGKELTENPKAALVFYWVELYRQIRIEGEVKLLESNKADNYFASRPKESQINAWCSKQSSTLEDLYSFRNEMKEMAEKFKDKEITRPDFWVGFCVIPKAIEFWHGGKHRNHTRYKYQLTEDNSWKIDQLYP
ncbi:pyridoxamine 5'-phosphate oxidase [Candidatus Mesenet endosymbiont of Phosphuga atrata]|uniref:pyridoxamine 5'-phosphate oxidase n=1 Tax=Candidatus Mesenet endosymbiont of Phosphuga atrata TaxID=3066221 RepID=UPI003977D287